MNLTAKPIVKGEFWVITDGKKKIGNVISDGSGFDVKIGNNIEHYTTTKQIEKKKHIQFEKIAKPSKEKKDPFAVFPTDSNRIYNSFYDVQRKLHIYTKTPKSKCYHVAGWFNMKQGDEFQPVFCPKYIFVQRYEYQGPFKTLDELNSSINNE